MQALDLTTIGAAVELPPRDHPIYSDYVEMPPLDMTPEEMAFKIQHLETRLANLMRFVGYLEFLDNGTG